MPENLRDLPPSPYESRVRADHPNATDQRCQIKKPHTEHPYGRIMPGGGLAYWCGGKS